MKIQGSYVLFSPLLLLTMNACKMQTGGSVESSKPNIILIMADDMGYSDIGCMGSEISTPNLDRLASEGLLMTRFYNAGRCCPSRAALMTGLYQHEVGVGDMLQGDSLPGYSTHLGNTGITMAEALKDAGYYTMISGKWHLGNDEPYWPMKRGFQRQYASNGTTGHYFGIAEGRDYIVEDRKIDPPGEWITAGKIRYKLFKNEDGSQWYATDAYTDRAIGYIRELRDSLPGKPFFLYLAYTAPHWPLQAFPEDIEKYSSFYEAGWDSLRAARYKSMVAKGIIKPSWKLSERNEHVPAWNSLDKEKQHDYSLLMEVYAAMIDRMDQNIGRLLESLRETGDLDHTLIIFLSDNGGCHEPVHRGKAGAVPGSADSFDGYEYAWANVSNTPFTWFKHWVNEGGISTPLIAWYPGMINPGRIDTTTGHIMDLMPTFIEVSGGQYPETYHGHDLLPLEGRSLLPLFRGDNMPDPGVLCWEHEGNRAVRKGKWKLVSRFNFAKNEPMPWELYDIVNDRTESEDLAHIRPEKAAELQKDYSEWAGRCGVVPFAELLTQRKKKR